METLGVWWAARTERERQIIRLGALFICGVLVPVWLCFAAYEYRNEAAARYAEAREVAAKVERINAAQRAHPAPSSGGGSIRERALAAAQAHGLSAARVEEIGADSLRIGFQPADSLAVYRWIDQVNRSGDTVATSTIVRVTGSELVNAEFEVRTS